MIEVPKEIDGAFLIEGSYRVPTNRLSGDFDCRITMSGTGKKYINFDYDRQYYMDKKVLKIKKNPYGLSDKNIEIPYEEIDTITDRDSRKKFLKLTDKQSKKFQVKLDLDYKPEYITTKLINECIAFGDDRLKDLIVDKSIESVAAGFMQFMFRSAKGINYKSARKQITSYFTKYNKIQAEINPISNLALKYFKGTQETKKNESTLQVPPGINAINLESLGNKVAIPETTAYNTTFSDLIDLADTPINNNTNLQNSLTVSAHVTDTDILFDVYDKNFNKITIPYLDYLNSKVCASESVDYKTKTLLPDKDGKVKVKYRMKRSEFPVDEIDLIDLHPDYRLSSTTRRIPFVNSTDSVRISMGCSMLSIILSNNIVICYVNLVKCWKPLKTNYSRFGHL